MSSEAADAVETAETGVGFLDEEDLMDDLSLSSPRSSALVAGDSCGPKCDLRLCRSIMLVAQSAKSTGVRLAACKKGSESCVHLSAISPGHWIVDNVRIILVVWAFYLDPSSNISQSHRPVSAEMHRS